DNSRSPLSPSPLSASRLVAGHLGVFAALARRQASRDGPRIARQPRRGVLGRRRRAIGRTGLVHGAPQSDRGVNCPPHHTRPSGVAASENPAGQAPAPAWQRSGGLTAARPNHDGGAWPSDQEPSPGGLPVRASPLRLPMAAQQGSP